VIGDAAGRRCSYRLISGRPVQAGATTNIVAGGRHRLTSAKRRTGIRIARRRLPQFRRFGFRLPPRLHPIWTAAALAALGGELTHKIAVISKQGNRNNNAPGGFDGRLDRRIVELTQGAW